MSVEGVTALLIALAAATPGLTRIYFKEAKIKGKSGGSDRLLFIGILVFISYFFSYVIFVLSVMSGIVAAVFTYTTNQPMEGPFYSLGRQIAATVAAIGGATAVDRYLGRLSTKFEKYKADAIQDPEEYYDFDNPRNLLREVCLMIIFWSSMSFWVLEVFPDVIGIYNEPTNPLTYSLIIVALYISSLTIIIVIPDIIN